MWSSKEERGTIRDELFRPGCSHSAALGSYSRYASERANDGRRRPFGCFRSRRESVQFCRLFAYGVNAGRGDVDRISCQIFDETKNCDAPASHGTVPLRSRFGECMTDLSQIRRGSLHATFVDTGPLPFWTLKTMHITLALALCCVKEQKAHLCDGT